MNTLSALAQRIPKNKWNKRSKSKKQEKKQEETVTSQWRIMRSAENNVVPKRGKVKNKV